MKNKPNTNRYKRMILILLVLMVSAMVILPSGCLDSEEEQGPVSPDNGSNDEDDLVNENPDSTVEFSEDDTPSEQNDDTEDTTPTRSFSSGSQVVDPPFTSGGNSDSSPSTPEVVEDVTIEIPSGSYTVTEAHVANLTITGDTSGTITLPDTLIIDGNLTVYTPYATVNNYATVGGTITIIQVSDDTWNQYGDAGKIVMQNGMGALSAGFEPMTKSKPDQTLNLMSGNIPGGIYIGDFSVLTINGGSTPRVTLVGDATVIVNNTATNLPDINVTPNAEGSDIDNLADEPLNLELHSNATVSGNINPDNDSYAHEVTSRGSLTVNPTVCPIGNESVTLTYTIGQDIVNGTISVRYNNLNTTGATYSIADGDVIALGSDYPAIFNEVDISKGQKIILSFEKQELTENLGGYYTFLATSNNSSVESRYAIATLKVLNNNTNIRGLLFEDALINADENGNYSTDVTYDTQTVNVSADLNDNAASMTINGNDIRSNVIKEITLNGPGTSTEVPIVVTAEDGVTTGTYTLTINRGEVPFISSANVSVSKSGDSVIFTYNFQNKSGSPVNYSEAMNTYYLDNTSSTVILKNTSVHYQYTTSPESFKKLGPDTEGNTTYETLADLINDFEDIANHYEALDTAVLNLSGGKKGYEWTLDTEFALESEEVSILHTFMVEQKALEDVSSFENNITIYNYHQAQSSVNRLSDGALKDSLQARIDNVLWFEYDEGTEVLDSNLSTFNNGTGLDYLRYVAKFTVHVEGNLTAVVKDKDTNDIFSSFESTSIPGNFWISFSYIVSNESHPTLKLGDRIPADTNVTVIYEFEAAERTSTIERNFTVNQSMFDNALPDDVISALTAVQTYEENPTEENKTSAQNAVDSLPDEYGTTKDVLQARIDAVSGSTSVGITAAEFDKETITMEIYTIDVG